MKRAPWLLLAVLLLPLAARAEGKCGDAPFRLDKDLVVTWVLPVPGNATVEQLPPGKCPGLLRTRRFERTHDRFTRGLKGKLTRTSIVAPSAERGKALELPPTGSLEALQKWEAQFAIPMEEEATHAIQSYLEAGFKLYGSVVRHPEVGEEQRRLYSQCSCTAQRAVVVHDGKQERIFLRSTFLSARRRGDHRLQFEPDGCLLVTFERPEFWFSQRFNSLVFADRTLVSIDLLTPRPVTAGGLPKGLTARPGGDVSFEGKTWKLVRIEGQLPTSVIEPPDLAFALPPLAEERR